jgi:hypothetical protein
MMLRQVILFFETRPISSSSRFVPTNCIASADATTASCRSEAPSHLHNHTPIREHAQGRAASRAEC